MKHRKPMQFFFAIPVLAAALVAAGCSSGVKKGAVASDPFPSELLGHKTFTIFKSGDPNEWLGRVFRDEQKQLLDEKVWEGKILASGGERREIEYDRNQALNIGARMPQAKLQLGVQYTGELNFKLVLEGLKVVQMVSPVMMSQYRDGQEMRGKEYIVSVLKADEVVIQLVDKKGAVIGAAAEYKKIAAEAKFEYSARRKGLIAAKDAIIGYLKIIPSDKDLKRQ